MVQSHPNLHRYARRQCTLRSLARRLPPFFDDGHCKECSHPVCWLDDWEDTPNQVVLRKPVSSAVVLGIRLDLPDVHLSIEVDTVSNGWDEKGDRGSAA